jgi:hypothetical protein
MKNRALTQEDLRQHIATLTANPTAANLALAKLLMRILNREVSLSVKKRASV